MKRHTLAILAFAGAAAIAPASKADTFVSGNICNTRAGTGAASVSLDPYGATNVTTTTDFIVNCAIPNPGTAATQLTLTAYDRSTTQDLTCGISAFDAGGNLVYTGVPVGTTGGGPGSNVQPVPLSLPNSLGRTFTANCMIPKAVMLSGTLWESHLVGFRIF
jgi:hypothetical protein